VPEIVQGRTLPGAMIAGGMSEKLQELQSVGPAVPARRRPQADQDEDHLRDQHRIESNGHSVRKAEELRCEYEADDGQVSNHPADDEKRLAPDPIVHGLVAPDISRQGKDPHLEGGMPEAVAP
jgi:hypothetical protein